MSSESKPSSLGLLPNIELVDRLYVHSIFKSISGETSPIIPQGTVCAFLRLEGCNLIKPCKWCDTAYAQKLDVANDSAKSMSFVEITNKIQSLKCKNIIITGGEPLYQKKGLLYLFSHLYQYEGNITISVETNGTIPFTKDDKYIIDKNFPSLPIGWVIDFKCEDTNTFLTEKLKVLKSFSDNTDKNKIIVKFLIQDKYDLDTAKDIIDFFEDSFLAYAFSPIQPNLSHETLYKWMMEEDWKQNVIYNFQVHKLTNLPEPK